MAGRTAFPAAPPGAHGYWCLRFFQEPLKRLLAAQGALQFLVGPGECLCRVAVRVLLEHQEGRHGLPEVFLERSLRAEHRAHLRLGTSYNFV